MHPQQTSQFTRPTLIAAAAVIQKNQSNAVFDRYMLELGLEETEVTQGTLPYKVNGLIRTAIANPCFVTPEGQNLWDALVLCAADFEKPRQWVGLSEATEVVKFVRCLARDGFVLEETGLRRSLPEEVDLPAADDEVHTLLADLDFGIASGHLDQAIASHTNGYWAAANGQMRTFFEALLDAIAHRLDATAAAACPNSNARRALLANLDPPFLSREGNEWKDGGPGYINGLFARLHAEGSHPGLSDEEDSTFRLHIVLLTARLLLRRLRARL